MCRRLSPRHRLLLLVGVGAATVQLVAPLAAAPQIVVDAPPTLAGAAEAVDRFDSSRLEQALATAGLQMPPEIHITLIDEGDPRARQTPRWVVGRAWGDDQIEIFPARVSGYPYDSMESVVRHEIVHLALDRRASGAVLPRWFHEGVAQAVGSDWGLFDEWQLFRAEAREPTPDELATLFESGREQETADAYRLATALVDDVRRRHGADIPGVLAARVAAGVRFDRAFAVETGETVEEAASRVWGAHRRLSRWVTVAASGQVLWTAILLLAVVALGAQLRRRARLRRYWDELDGGG
jgi:hypothetical protein